MSVKLRMDAHIFRLILPTFSWYCLMACTTIQSPGQTVEGIQHSFSRTRTTLRSFLSVDSRVVVRTKCKMWALSDSLALAPGYLRTRAANRRSSCRYALAVSSDSPHIAVPTYDVAYPAATASSNHMDHSDCVKPV